MKILLLPEQDFCVPIANRFACPVGFFIGGAYMFRVPKRIENLFGKRIANAFQNLVNRILKGKKPVEQEIRDFTMSKEMSEYIDKSVNKMVNEQRVTSGGSWAEAARRKKTGRQIVDYIKNEMKGSVGQRVAELVKDNSAYIKSLPTKWADRASEVAFKMALEGKRPEEIEAELRKQIPAEMQRNIKTIARTEAAKANAAIAQARAEDLGITCYIWKTCNDERVRPSHQRMNGVLCFWNDPPAPEGSGAYHPGNIYNCRCYAEPVLDIRDLDGRTMKVWNNGSVQMLSKRKTMKINRRMR